MALEFVTGSKTFDIIDYSVIKSIGNKNSIESECFTDGGYNFVIQFYPQGSNESVSDYASVSLKVLNATKPVRAMNSFSLWDWTTTKWSSTMKSVSPISFLRNSAFNKYIKSSDLKKSDYLKNDTLRIKCTIFVIPQGDRPAGNPSGANISIDNGFHMASYAPPNAPSNIYTGLPRQPTLRIYCEANRHFSVTVRNGTVVLAPADSNDHYQHWIKDTSSYAEDRDMNGLPAFALVNRVTGEALKNPIGENQPVTLVRYNTNAGLNDQVKWTETEPSSTGFHAIRITDVPSLNMTVLTHGGIDKFSDDGTKIVVQNWADTPIQHWKMAPYDSHVPFQFNYNLN